MEFIGLIFDTLFFAPIVNLLVLVLKLLETANIPGALGFSIIILSIAIRFLIWPATTVQVRSSQKMAALKPLLDELKSKHKDDKKALQLAQMALYKEHGVNPASGCLPILIQFPIFIALYQAILNVFPGVSGGNLDTINRLLYHPWLHLSSAPPAHFFGLNLATRPWDFGLSLFFIPAVTAVLTFVQSKMMLGAKGLSHHSGETPKEVKEKESMEDTMVAVQGQMVYLVPVMIGYFAFQFPIGLSIYWNTFTIMGIIQQYKIAGWGGMTDLVGKFKFRI